mgnify:CR=1 FL=1
MSSAAISMSLIDIQEGPFLPLRILSAINDKITTIIGGSEEAKMAVRSADLVLGAVLLPGRKPPVVIMEEDIDQMEKGTVIIDVAIDQGGCVENVKPNTHSEPFEIRNGVIVSAIANLPGAVPKLSLIHI